MYKNEGSSQHICLLGSQFWFPFSALHKLWFQTPVIPELRVSQKEKNEFKASIGQHRKNDSEKNEIDDYDYQRQWVILRSQHFFRQNNTEIHMAARSKTEHTGPKISSSEAKIPAWMKENMHEVSMKSHPQLRKNHKSQLLSWGKSVLFSGVTQGILNTLLCRPQGQEQMTNTNLTLWFLVAFFLLLFNRKNIKLVREEQESI